MTTAIVWLAKFILTILVCVILNELLQRLVGAWRNVRQSRRLKGESA